MSTAKVVFTNWSSDFKAEWAGDFLNREHLLPGGAKLDVAAFAATDAVTVTTTDAAIVGATAIPVAALSGPIPNGTVLDFTGAGELAVLTAAAAAGATSLTVEALDAAIEDGDTATYAGVDATLHLPSGTVVGRTYAERDAGTGFGPAADADDEIYLLAFDITDVNDDNDCDLYRHGGIVKENFLPQIDTLSAGLLAAIRERYETTIGVV